MRRRRLTSVLVLLCCTTWLLTACQASSAIRSDKITDAVKFVSDAAQKTASQKNLTFEATGFGSVSDNTKATMTHELVYMVPDGKEGAYCKWYQIGRQTEGQPEITYECNVCTVITEEDYDPTREIMAVPLNTAQHDELKRYLKTDTSVQQAENGVRSVSCMMTFGDFIYLSTGELKTRNISKPVRLTFYVDAEGYLCEFRYETAVHPNGSGDIYTNSFVYRDFRKTSFTLADLPSETTTVLSNFPKGKDNSTLTHEMLRENVSYPTYTTEDIAKNEGIYVNDGSDLAAMLHNDGTLTVLDDGGNTVVKDIAESWTDVVYVANANYGNVLAAIKANGSVAIADWDDERVWNLSAFTDIQALHFGDCSYANGYSLYGLKKDGTVVTAGEGAADLSSWKDVAQFSVYDGNIIALTNNGTVLTHGEYDIADAQSWTDIVMVCAGRFHVAGLKKDGTVVTAGTNPLEEDNGPYGEHDVSDWQDIVYIGTGNMSTIGIKKDGTVVAVGYDCEYVNEWTDVVYLSFGKYSCIEGIRANGTIYGGPEDWDLF